MCLVLERISSLCCTSGILLYTKWLVVGREPAAPDAYLSLIYRVSVRNSIVLGACSGSYLTPSSVLTMSLRKHNPTPATTTEDACSVPALRFWSPSRPSRSESTRARGDRPVAAHEGMKLDLTTFDDVLSERHAIHNTHDRARNPFKYNAAAGLIGGW